MFQRNPQAIVYCSDTQQGYSTYYLPPAPYLSFYPSYQQYLQQQQLNSYYYLQYKLSQQQQVNPSAYHHFMSLTPPMIDLPAESKPSVTPKMQMTVTEKLARSELFQRHIQRKNKKAENEKSCSVVIIEVSEMVPELDCSQVAILKKINLYLSFVKKAPISEKGHCHSMALLWLLLMALDAEEFFYNMVREIAVCTSEQLLKRQKLFETFLMLIDLGQNPGKYSDNTCTQMHVDKILGVDDMKMERGKFTEHQLLTKLHAITKKNSMIDIRGWGKKKWSSNEVSHAVGFFVRGAHDYCVYDANNRSGRHRRFSSLDYVEKEIKYCLYDRLNAVSEDSMNLQFNITHLPMRIKSDIQNTALSPQQAEVSSAAAKKHISSVSILGLFKQSTQNNEVHVDIDKIERRLAKGF